MKSCYDTSSSLYPETQQQAFGFTTPSPRSPINQDSIFNTALTPKFGFKDDVYKPYITPPTPFEESTKQQSEIDIDSANPYAQSLWYTFRGTDGAEEIGRYKKVKPVGVIARVPEPIKIKRSELLPSMMAKKEEVVVVDHDGETDSLQIIEKYDYDAVEREEEEKILKPLNNPPPFEFISIQSKLVKKLTCLLEISSNFKKYNDEHKILLNSKVRLYLFSNIKTLLILHMNFFNSIIDRDEGTDIEILVHDHLQRLYHVYPSYLNTMMLRNHFTALVVDNERFRAFLGGGEDMKEEFSELVMSPSKDFHKLLIYLDSYMGGSSPRIKVLIGKFLKHFNDPNGGGGGENGVFMLEEPLFLEVPKSWKVEHPKKWKEVQHFNTQGQLSYFLKSQLLEEFEKYVKIINIIKLQIEQISNISIVNNYIIKKFMKVQNELPLSSELGHENYGNRLVYVDKQNKEIYELLRAFTYFISDESFKETERMVNRACKICKRVIKGEDEVVMMGGGEDEEDGGGEGEMVGDDDGDGVEGYDDGYIGDKIFEVYEFKRLFEERLFLIFLKFIRFFESYIRVMKTKNGMGKGKVTDDVEEDFRTIINSFERKRGVLGGADVGEAQLEQYNQEIGRAFAKGKLKKRFFNRW